MKRLVLVFCVFLFFISCSGYDTGTSSDEAKRYEILKAIDEGRYDYVIQRLEPDPTYGGVFTLQEGRLNLAAAYAGKAGFDANDIVASLIDSSEEDEAFQSFVSSLAGLIGRDGYPLLDLTSEQYLQIADNCSSGSLTDIQKDACFYRAVVEATKAVTAFSFIVEDPETWLNPQGCTEDADNNTIGDSADATACAIEYALNGNCSNATVSSTGTVSFGSVSFEWIEITVGPKNPPCSDNNTFYRLITAGGEAAVTDGYCNNTTFGSCSVPDPAQGCYPCPVFDPEGNPYTVVGTVAETLMDSSDIISVLLPQEGDLQDAVNDFIDEVCSQDGDNSTCTQKDIQLYLQN